MYGLIGNFKAKPGKRDALVAAMLDDDTPIPGCISFVVAHDASDPDSVWITEVWDSEASHKASLSLSAVQSSIKSAMPLIATFNEHIRTQPVGGQGLRVPS